MIQKFVLFLTILIFAAEAKKKSQKRKSDPFEKEEQLNKFIEEDEGHLMEPYIGGFNSDQAQILIVKFHPFADIKERINPRWPTERDMVKDMQTMLLTGGVKTNVFKSKASNQFAFVLNDRA